MTKIKAVGKYIPESRRSVAQDADRFDVTEEFLQNKIGVATVAKTKPDEGAAEMCLCTYEDLALKLGYRPEPGLVLVCTQTPNYRIPHVSALVHKELGIKMECACFDISLGCSGYVYALSVAKSFMESNGISNGLVFTSDPYSKILDINDRNTFMLFGDAASATLLAADGFLNIDLMDFITASGDYDALICRHGETLSMDGRRIFNFVMRHVPVSVESCLKKNGMAHEDIDLYLFHQASKYVLDNLCARMKLPRHKVPFDIAEYGNTVSSSIPLLLERYINEDSIENILVCGFGVGLSLATSLLRRI